MKQRQEEESNQRTRKKTKGDRAMRSESLLHDTAWAMAHALMNVVAHNFREEEQRELFSEFYNAARAGLEAFCVQETRIERRICPSKN